MSKKAPKNEFERAYFPFFGSFAEALDNLGDDKTELELYRAITHYGLYGKEPELSGVANAFWALLKPVLEKSRKYFENGKKGAPFGGKGGNPNFQKGKPNPYYNPKDNPKDNPDITPKITTDKERDKDKDKDKDNKISPISNEICPLTEQGGGVSLKKRGYVGENTPDDTDKAKRFKRPSVDEVRDYIASHSYSVDAEAFCDFYEAKGWRVGNNPMKNWQAAVRTWERRNKSESKANPKKSAAPNGVKLGVGEWIDDNGLRRYGTGKYSIPMEAPPRPGDKYAWDAGAQNWVIL